jgi:hypothetical protein
MAVDTQPISFPAGSGAELVENCVLNVNDPPPPYPSQERRSRLAGARSNRQRRTHMMLGPGSSQVIHALHALVMILIRAITRIPCHLSCILRLTAPSIMIQTISHTTLEEGASQYHVQALPPLRLPLFRHCCLYSKRQTTKMKALPERPEQMTICPIAMSERNFWVRRGTPLGVVMAG